MYEQVQILTPDVELEGDLFAPDGAHGVILFAHGSGSSRTSPRNRFVADILQEAGFTTVLMDLLTAAEEEEEQETRHLRFDIALLAQRLVAVMKWLEKEAATMNKPLGLFGASTGAAAALVAAAQRPSQVKAVVSRGGRPDLAGASLASVMAPTLLIVGGADTEVVAFNREALEQLRGPTELEVIPDAGHLFEEPGALDRVAELASAWFQKYVRP